MFRTVPIAFFWLIVILFVFGCKKENAIADQDLFVEHAEELTPLDANVSSAGTTFIELQWKQVTNTHFNPVTYSVFLNDEKISERITTNKFSLINLKPAQKYAVKIIASTATGKQLSQLLEVSTLNASIGNQGIYVEYSIHNYSTLTGGTALQRLNDGGHLIARLLQHPLGFDKENFKIVVFRTDASGKMMWYRLFSLLEYNVSFYGQLVINVNKNGQDGLIFLHQHAVRFALNNGEILQKKSFAAEAGNASFSSSFSVSDSKMVLGTEQGNLLAINPGNLSLIWQRTNPDRQGAVGEINVDTKNNIYYVFTDGKAANPKITVIKCKENGEYLKAFDFDGTLPNEYASGYSMKALLVDGEDNFYLFGRNNSYNYMRWFKFNAEGVVIKKNQVSDNLNVDRATFNAHGEIVVSGQVDGSLLATFGGIYVFDKEMNIKSKRVYQDLPFHLIRGLTVNTDGSYNIFLNFRTTSTYNNPYFIFIKTDIDGKF